MLAEYVKTAKRGLWMSPLGALKDIMHLTLKDLENAKTYVTDFAALTQGAFFVKAEGGESYYLLLVVPDNSIDWSGLSSMSVQGAVEYLQDYNIGTPIPSWVEFVEWFDTQYEKYKDAVRSATICGRSVTTIPPYYNPTHIASVWFSWLATIGDSAGLDELAMTQYKISDYQYRLPMTITSSRGTFSMGIRLTT